MMPCISPRRPPNVMPSGGVSGLPFLSNTAIEWPPYVVNQALSWASTAAPNVPPSIPPPVKPVVIGESGLPLGANLVAWPCHNESCPCQPTVKLSPTQRFPSLSNMHLPPATYPPPVNLSGSTHALGAQLRYGIYGTVSMWVADETS